MGTNVTSLRSAQETDRGQSYGVLFLTVADAAQFRLNLWRETVSSTKVTFIKIKAKAAKEVFEWPDKDESSRSDDDEGDEEKEEEEKGDKGKRKSNKRAPESSGAD